MIDRDYRGNIGVILFNLAKQDFKSESKGTTIVCVYLAVIVEVHFQVSIT